METLLVGVTLVSLALAAAMAAVAWKLLHAERERSAARADALHALAFDEPAPVPDIAVDDLVIREPDEPSGLDLDPPAAPEPAAVRIRTPAPHFATADPAPGSSRAATLTIAALVAAAVVVLAVALWSSNLAAGGPGGFSLASLFTRARPLELLSLRNTRGPDGGFVVTGLVENPAGGSRRDDLEAVVYLFDREGRYFASGHSAIDESRLDPGEQSPFVVTVRNASAVSRYRVGFRQHDGGPVAHVDRRRQLPAASPDTALAGTQDAPFDPGAIRPGTGLAP
jgi:hypothetical protein